MLCALSVGGAHAADAPPIDTNPPATVWKVGDDGVARHQQTLLACPAAVAGFRRTSLVSYKPGGADVSCDLRDASDAIITMHITAVGDQPLDDLFDSVSGAVTQLTPDTERLPAADQKSFDSKLPLKFALYREGDAQTGVWATKFTSWMLQFRATYKSGDHDAVFAALSALADVAQASAGQHLAGCVADPVARVGKRVAPNDPKIFEYLISATLSAKVNANAARPQPKAWCMDAVLKAGDRYLTLWHYPSEPGSNRVTGDTGAEALAYRDQLLTVLNKGEAATIYNVIIVEGDRIRLVGLFDGPPPIDAMLQPMLGGAYGIYADIDVKTNKIKLYNPF